MFILLPEKKAYFPAANPTNYQTIPLLAFYTHYPPYITITCIPTHIIRLIQLKNILNKAVNGFWQV